MSIREKICPVCGKTEKEVKFHNFICVEDFLATRELKLPPKLTVYYCKYGDKFAADVKRWKEKPEEMSGELGKNIKSIGGKVVGVVVDNDQMVIHFDIEFDGKILKRDVPLKLKESLCDKHQRSSRGYYEAIVQLRSREGFMDPKTERIEKLAERITMALHGVHVDKKEVKGGIDLYIDSKQATFDVLKSMRFKTTTTRKLGGVKKGREVYRTTFLVRV